MKFTTRRRRPRAGVPMASIALAAIALGSLFGAACTGGSDASDGDGGTGDDGPAPSAEVEAARGDLLFTEVASDAGITGSASDLALTGEAAMSSGAAVADVDGDGDLDIFLPRIGKPNALYLNDGKGSFTDEARRAGLAGAAQRFGSAAAAFLDLEGDGDMDLFVAGSGQGGNDLFVNDGTGVFTEESTLRGLVWPDVTDAEAGSQHHGVSVADVDHDGDMDLLVLQWFGALYNAEAVTAAMDAGLLDDESAVAPCSSSAAFAELGFPIPEGTPENRSGLFLNDGAGNFSDGTEQLGLPLHELVAFTGSFGDVDGDGWQDLAITGDGCTSRLFLNVDGSRFEDVTGPAGVASDENGMGSVLRDVDGDGRLDWFITSIAHPDGDACRGGGFFGCSGNRLFLNAGPGDGTPVTFTDATDDYGVRDGGWGWGAAIEDFSNDGRLEITMTNGYRISDDATADPDSFHAPFYEDTTRMWALHEGRYVDVAAAAGIDDTTIGHAMIAFDMDGDGDLDLLIVPTDDPPLLYRNDTPQRSWLGVALDDPSRPGNRWGDGARVSVIAAEGDEPVVGWITTTGSYESQSPARFHVGLGDHDGPIERVEITWPGDAEPQVLTDVEPNQLLVVERGT